MNDLITRLRDGVPTCDETSLGNELCDIDAAETTMAEAADEIERLRNLLDRYGWNR